MQIMDSQIHDVGPWADWTGEGPETQHRIMTELVLAYLDAVGVHGVVLFTGGGHHDDAAIWGTAQLPDRLAYVPPISPEMPDVDGAIRAAKNRKGQLGIRALIGWPLDGSEVKRLEAGVWDPVFAACEKHQFPLFLFITGWLDRVPAIVAKFPHLPLVIDHLGLRQPPMDNTEDPPFKSLHHLLALGKFPNVSVKLCGLPAMSRERYPFRDVVPHLRSIVDAFGADRLMWGSDITRFAGRIGLGRFQNPRTFENYTGKHTYAESLHFISDSDVLKPAEKEAILGGSLRRILNWNSSAK